VLTGRSLLWIPGEHGVKVLPRRWVGSVLPSYQGLNTCRQGHCCSGGVGMGGVVGGRDIDKCRQLGFNMVGVTLRGEYHGGDTVAYSA
jgi:hypothetical protein